MKKQTPFTITDVADLLSIQRLQGGTEDSFGVVCPFCNDIRGKCNFCVAKDGEIKNVYHCYHCGAAGNMLTLYVELTGLCGEDRYKNAYWEIKERLAAGDSSIRKISYQSGYQRKKRESKKEMEVDPAYLNAIYHAMIAMLDLKESHKRQLRKRGLSDADIKLMFQNGYRSTNAEDSVSIARRLIKSGFSLKGIPGFFVNRNGDWDTAFYPSNEGMLCPVYTVDRKIAGFQIRLDRPSKKRKYLWFTSSGLDRGTSSKSPAGLSGVIKENEVWVTEGILKAQIASLQSGRAYIGTPGVSNYKGLQRILCELKAKGLETVYECYDMDKMLCLDCRMDYDRSCDRCVYEKHAFSDYVCPRKSQKRDMIRGGCLKLYDICRELDLNCLRVTWDISEAGLWNGSYKGIDDWLMRKNSDKRMIIDAA